MRSHLCCCYRLQERRCRRGRSAVILVIGCEGERPATVAHPVDKGRGGDSGRSRPPITTVLITALPRIEFHVRKVWLLMRRKWGQAGSLLLCGELLASTWRLRRRLAALQHSKSCAAAVDREFRFVRATDVDLEIGRAHV